MRLGNWKFVMAPSGRVILFSPREQKRADGLLTHTRKLRRDHEKKSASFPEDAETQQQWMAGSIWRHTISASDNMAEK